ALARGTRPGATATIAAIGADQAGLRDDDVAERLDDQHAAAGRAAAGLLVVDEVRVLERTAVGEVTAAAATLATERPGEFAGDADTAVAIDRRPPEVVVGTGVGERDRTGGAAGQGGDGAAGTAIPTDALGLDDEGRWRELVVR